MTIVNIDGIVIYYHFIKFYKIRKHKEEFLLLRAHGRVGQAQSV